MTPQPDKNNLFSRFVSCVIRCGLLRIRPQAAGCTRAGGELVMTPVFFRFDGDFQPVLPDAINLNGGGIFRGKISRPETQTNKNRLEERTLSAPNS